MQTSAQMTFFVTDAGAVNTSACNFGSPNVHNTSYGDVTVNTGGTLYVKMDGSPLAKEDVEEVEIGN